MFSVVVVVSQFAVHFNGSAEGTYPALQVQAPVFLFQVVLVVSQDGPGAINGLFDYSTVGSERISSVESNGSGKVRPLSFFFSSVVQSDMKLWPISEVRCGLEFQALIELSTSRKSCIRLLNSSIST